MTISAIMEKAREVLGESTGLKVVKIIDAIRVCKCWKLLVELQDEANSYVELYEIMIDDDGNPVEMGIKLTGKLKTDS